MSRQPLFLLLSAVAWAGFIAVVLWSMGFLADGVVPRVVDGPPRTNTAVAVATDLALLLLFAVQHSVMARPQFKALLRRHIPPVLERASYVVATDICLVLLLLMWQPLGGQVWQVHGAASFVLWSLCAVGWLLAITATFAVDHLELTGLRQAGWARPRSSATTNELKIEGLHAIVRHPMMTGLVLAFWATPHMTVGHLLFAVMTTGYILVGVRLEERDLVAQFGTSYEQYRRRVPMLMPRLFGGRSLLATKRGG
ncbi:MAG: methyltransferase family protein [Nocardioidaceae bacterium]